MPKHTLTGNIKRHRAFPSKILGNRRDVLVYLPRGYRSLSRRRYPVLYLHDGQNVFDAATSFSGVEWSVDETAERLIKESLIEPLIIVAVANIGEERIHEYAPTRGVIDAKAKRKKRSKGLARKYGHFLIDELKPYIDRKYRTNPDAEFTGLGGSSLGGLVTLAIGILYSNAFSRLMVMSPSIWWDDFAIYRLVDSIEQKPPLKSGSTPAQPNRVGNKRASYSNVSLRKAGNFKRIFNTWKLSPPITAKRLGRRGFNRRCSSCFRQQNRISSSHRWNRRRIRRQWFRRRSGRWWTRLGW